VGIQAQRWRPTRFLVVSAGVQLASVVGILAWPSWWLIWLTPLLISHLLVVCSGLFPRSSVLGPNLKRLTSETDDDRQVALTFDDGPHPEITPEVLRILHERGVKATFFLVGIKAAQYPELVRQVAADGHEIGNHTWSHSAAFYFFGPARLRTELDWTQRLLAELSGKTPRYFRPPAGIRSPLAEPFLQRRNLQLVSWTRRGFDTVCRDPEKVLMRLLGQVAPGDILLLHDGNVALTKSGDSVVLQVLPRLLDALENTGLKLVPLSVNS